MNSATRSPAVAGLFYPQDPEMLRRKVKRLLEQANNEYAAPKAMIAPHAGYQYSGPIAASAYASLISQRERISRVIMLGPAHRAYVKGIAASSKMTFNTPLGDIPLATDTIAALVDTYDFVSYSDTAHEQEHSLEVHLPFLQQTLAAFSLVPLAVGEANYAQVQAVLEHCWGGDETLIVVSSDLSHYHDYATAQRMDRATSTAIERLSAENISHEQACGRIPIGGLLQAAKTHNLHAVNIDTRNSGDTAGPREQVVGYGAYLFLQNHARH